MSESSNTAQLYGLVLAGGRSSRMQQDKAALSYHGPSQLEWALSLVGSHVRRAFISIRPDQTAEPLRARFAQIVDQHHDLGPLAGILAAQAQYPHAAWLILACDLPFLNEDTLTRLIRLRQPQRLATAYRSIHDGLPEPLCAIYEPASREALLAYAATGKSCPRKFLINSDVQIIEASDPRALDNVNTPKEYDKASYALHRGSNAMTQEPGSASKHIKVQYYALLREQAGRSEEDIVTSARNARELYDDLRSRYPFSLASNLLRVAVNAEFGDWDQPLTDGDSVVFIPPVAGG